MKLNLKNKFFTPPSLIDVLLGILFIIAITFQPFYLRGEINTFELGIYLPGIQAILDGLVPYRDFFHLRGPMELYIPALLMQIFGEHVAVLTTYFYVGTVLTLIIFMFLSAQIFQTRIIFYLFMAVFVARTFPRVVFTHWGGLRYALGVLAIFCAVLFFKKQKRRWLLLAGLLTAVSFLTSIEIGVCDVFGILGALILSYFLVPKKVGVKDFIFYLVPLFLMVAFYCVYLFYQNGLSAYFDMTLSVIRNMQSVFDMKYTSNLLSNLWQAFGAFINPSSESFKHMTPAYVYIALLGYRFFYLKRKKNDAVLTIVCLGLYGVMMYITSFRNIEASQFEMALQPEKLIYFFLLEEVLLYFKSAPKVLFNQVTLLGVVLFVLIGSSLGYAIQRFNHRFIAFKYLTFQKPTKLIPLRNEETQNLNLPRIKGMVVPSWQAKDFNDLTAFFDKHTEPKEKVFMFPELGFYSFVIDRAFIGRFPMGTFSWLNDSWHQEYLNDFKKNLPQYVVMDLKLHPKFEEQYFKVEGNRIKYNQLMEFVQKHYTLVHQTPTLGIYQCVH